MLTTWTKSLCIAASLSMAAAQTVDFRTGVEPLLKRCTVCHGDKQQMSGLRLDRGADALRGGYSGPAIRPGDSANSRLIDMVAGKGKIVMPPVGPKLTEAEVATLRQWIDQGATWPASATPEAKPTSRRSTHWSFQPIRRPVVPRVVNARWSRGPLDRFVLARLEKEKLAPAPEAGKSTLLRRIHLDLTGLPPTPAELADFLADTRPDAYERAVDRLLASPHYGEKWARHWLDLARYADSDGYESDKERPNAWRYRDWVIDALNRDLPFDRFTIEQMAGDLLPNASLDQLVATGFHRNTLTNREGGVDTEQFRVEQVLDRTSTLGTVWLGLSVGCAQCHDHKYDPISHKDYYSLYAFFNTAIEQDISTPQPGEARPDVPAFEALYAEFKLHEVQAAWERKLLDARANPGRDAEWDTNWKFLGNNSIGGQAIVRLAAERRTRDQREQLAGWFLQFGLSKMDLPKERLEAVRKKLKEMNAAEPIVTRAPTIREAYDPPKTHMLLRGDFRQTGIAVDPATPPVLHAFPNDAPRNRLGLARWLVARENPLTARVAVNRMWQEFFGRGLVRTSEDFGTQGERPSHPELLDWLASEFIDGGWSMKRMHRLIVTSAAYRQSSHVAPALLERDPDNILLARQSRLRLPAELIRDSALAAAGMLNTAIGGKSVRPPQPKGVAELGYANSVKWRATEGPGRDRRGLYIHFQRTVPYPQLVAFDAPDSNMSCSRRSRSTTPLQALNLLNDPVFFEAAQRLAFRVSHASGPEFARRLDLAFRLTVARPATQPELQTLATLFDRQTTLLTARPKEAVTLFPFPLGDAIEGAGWTAIARVLLNSDEFLHRE